LLVAGVSSPKGCKLCLEVKPRQWGISASAALPTSPLSPAALNITLTVEQPSLPPAFSTPLSQGFWRLLASLGDSQRMLPRCSIAATWPAQRPVFWDMNSKVDIMFSSVFLRRAFPALLRATS